VVQQLGVLFAFCRLAHTFANNLCFACLPELLQVNPNKPECNGPFTIYKVPDLDGAEKGSQYKGYYMILKIAKEFFDLDDKIAWFSGSIIDEKRIKFRFPSYPFGLWPWQKNDSGEKFMAHIQQYVPMPVQRAMNDAHSVFADRDSSEVLSRQWQYIILDFSADKDSNHSELSSKVLFKEAGDKEILDFDIIEFTSTETWLGFKVAWVEDGRSGGRKVARQEEKLSAFAQKKKDAAAAAARATPDQPMSNSG
jgi:hypothetical protein